MRQKSSNALTYQKVIHNERMKQEDVDNDPVARSHIQVYKEKLEKELEPVPYEIVAGECLPDPDEYCDMDVWSPTSTLTHPNSIHQTASLDRMALAEKTGYQDLCIDAADTIGAANSLEKMMAHQMAICHAVGMNLVIKSNKTSDEIVKLKILNTATKFMEVFQKGFDSIHKVKRGNRQTVVVKHQQFNVNEGGQAVIANFAGGAKRRRGDAK